MQRIANAERLGVERGGICDGSYVNSHHLSHARACKGVSHRCSIRGLAWITIPNNALQDVDQKTPKWVDVKSRPSAQAELHRRTHSFCSGG